MEIWIGEWERGWFLWGSGGVDGRDVTWMLHLAAKREKI